MKKNYTILLLFGILLMLAGCKKDNLSGIPEGALLLTTEGFVGPGGTKTSVSNTTVQWGNGDTVKLNDNLYRVTVSGSQAYVENFTPPTSGDYYGFYPHDLTVTMPETGDTTVIVPSLYKCHYSGGRQIIKLPLIGKANYDANTISFLHVTAAVKLDIKNATGVPVVLDSMVVSSATQQLSGSCGVAISVGGLTVDAPQAASSAADKRVKVTFTDSPVIATNGTNAIKEVQIPILPIAAGSSDITISIYSHATGAAPGAQYIFSRPGNNPALARNEMMTAKIALSDGGSSHATGLITVDSLDHKVFFSQANLMYLASTREWRFHDHQWDYFGSGAGNTTAEANRATQPYWIDLFGWGTSNYEEKNAWMTDTIDSHYGHGSDSIAGTHYDWGVHNPIANGGNVAGIWRTLTSTEWNYVLNRRGNAAVNYPRYIKAVIGENHQGLIIFPDGYVHPEDCGSIESMNTPNPSLTWIPFDEADWNKMESLGAVFLPAAGYRGDNTVKPFNPTAVLSAGQEGVYWSSSASSTGNDNAYRILFSNSGTGDYAATNPTPRRYGYAVRLVQDVPSQSN